MLLAHLAKHAEAAPAVTTCRRLAPDLGRKHRAAVQTGPTVHGFACATSSIRSASRRSRNARRRAAATSPVTGDIAFPPLLKVTFGALKLAFGVSGFARLVSGCACSERVSVRRSLPPCESVELASGL